MAKKKRKKAKKKTSKKKRRKKRIETPPTELPKPRTNPDRPLTAKELEFGYQYVRDWNGTRAARAAGYSRNSARSRASELLRNVKVQRLIRRLRKLKRRREMKLADKVQREIARVGLGDIRDLGSWGKVSSRGDEDERDTGEQRNLAYFTPHDSDALTDDAAAIISEIACDDKGRIKLKTHSKMQALHELVKLLDMYGRAGGEEAKTGTHEVVISKDDKPED
jgi:phage terminase small subunit